jgi:hypothetical protein
MTSVRVLVITKLDMADSGAGIADQPSIAFQFPVLTANRLFAQRLSGNLRPFNQENADCACCEAESAFVHDLSGFRFLTLCFAPVFFTQARLSSVQITGRFPPLSIAHAHAS